MTIRHHVSNCVVSPVTLNAIRARHPLRHSAVQISPGVCEIGYGHRHWTLHGLSVTPIQAEDLFRVDVMTAEAYLRTLIEMPLTDGEYQALVSLVFDIGAPAFIRSDILNLLNNGCFEAARLTLAVFAGASRFGLATGEAARAWEAACWLAG